jgi:Copper amine oxidase N-terminal domain
MNKTRYLMVAVVILVCFGVVFSASAASQLTAKQIMLDRLQSAEFIPTGDINKTASGTAYYQVKTLNGMLASSFAPVAKMAGADLKMDYKLDSPDNKMEMHYFVNYDGGQYYGSMFIDEGKMILTTEIFTLLNNINAGIIPAGKVLPPYAYTSDQSIPAMWGNFNRGQYIPPEFKELMIFFVEAIPEEYFSVSLTDQQIEFVLDQQGFEVVTLAVLNKVADERERFASIVESYFATAGGQPEAAEMMKKELLAGIEKSIKDGSYPDTQAEVQKMMAGIVVMKELRYEASILSPGQNSMNMIMDIGGGPDFSGQVVIKSDFTSGKDLLKGTYSIDVKAIASAEQMNVEGLVTGEFNQTATSSKSHDTFKVNVKNQSDGTSMLNLLIEGDADAKADPNVQVTIPVLTAANSIELEKLMENTNASNKNTPVINLNGVPVAFDVDPYMVQVEGGSRTLVPLRSLAEALGFEVGWVEPDQINIMRGGSVINMYINKSGYMVNGMEKQLDAPPFIMGSRTMVPLRFIAEELGCTVQYDGATNTVNISTN